MRRLGKYDFWTQDDQYISGLALEWYFLNLFFLKAEPEDARQVVDPLLEAGRRLKWLLSRGGFTFLEPLTVCVEHDLYFEIWLDADQDIQASDLFMVEGDSDQE